MKKYKHIFFDLDRTLWDFETNSHVVLNQLMDENDLENKCKSSRKAILKTYYLVNDDLWKRYRQHLITKEELRTSRFYNTMLYFGHDDIELGHLLEKEYIARSPYQTNLIPHTIDVLDYLSQHYKLHIITNGFKEVQHIKLENSGLAKYFDEIIISEEAGCNKPDPKIFEHALQRANTNASESVMIGDDLHADVVGAKDVGMWSVYFNPEKFAHTEEPHHEIQSLKELLDLL